MLGHVNSMQLRNLHRLLVTHSQTPNRARGLTQLTRHGKFNIHLAGFLPVSENSQDLARSRKDLGALVKSVFKIEDNYADERQAN